MDFLYGFKERAEVKRKAIKEAEQIFRKLHKGTYPSIHRDTAPSDYTEDQRDRITNERQVVKTRMAQYKAKKK